MAKKTTKKPAKKSAPKGKKKGELRDQEVDGASGGVDGSVFLGITSYAGGSSSSDTPTESVSFTYGSQSITYKPQK